MTIRLEFVAEALLRRRSITALCVQYGISEKTGYKWLSRFRIEGPKGLADAAHAPRTCPHATSPDQCARLVALRRAHPTWGARKLRDVLAREAPELHWPAPSTITTLLHHAALIAPRRRRVRAPGAAGARGPCAATAPNELWTIDYKGQFRTQDGQWCYPLTVVDHASRYLLACVAHPAPETTVAQRVLERCFATYGIPQAILSDNGPPFGAAHAPRGFSRLTCWLRTLGIQPHFTVPGHPEHNPRHERFHRTLKADATRPPAASLRAQQPRFDTFRATYNTVRPHDALGGQPPAAVYHPSTRPWPVRPAPLSYPTHFHERKVTSAGLIWWHREDIYLSLSLAGQTVGLDPVTPQCWDVYFAEYLLGTMDLTTLRFTQLTASLTSPITPV
jgi:transposase InsO family protein